MISHKIHSANEPRGTVLILCVALLVILGMVASSFVIMSHAERTSSRALSRADQFEQVRQMSLVYVQTLLLEDLVGNDGIFLNGATTGETDEAYDSPGADPWLSSHGPQNSLDLEIDTDKDGYKESKWIVLVDDPKFPGFALFADSEGPDGSANVVGLDGTRYRVAIRIVDTNGLANINVGMGQDIDDIIRKKWDGEFPYYLYLAGLNAGDNGAWLDNGNGVGLGSRPGRIPGHSDLSDLHESLFEHLYKHLGNSDYEELGNLAPIQDYIRPFDVAEELALRMWAASGVDLHSRLGTLWSNTFDAKSDLLTAYSWTMQIRPPTNPAPGLDANEIDTELARYGFPSPCKVSLRNLLRPANIGTANTEPDQRRCTAVYLALLAAGMDKESAAQFLVNLVDYLDWGDPDDTWIHEITPSTPDYLIERSALPAGLRPSGTYYGTDNQPIISEIYSYRFYQGADPDGDGIYDYTLVPANCRYAVELFNPTDDSINLFGWELEIGGIPSGIGAVSIPAKGFVTLVSNSDISTNGTEIVLPTLVITTNGGPQTIKLIRWSPFSSPSAQVAVDRFEGTFAGDPDPGTDLTKKIIESVERPGRLIPPDTTNYAPVIAGFPAVTEILADGHTLGSYPTTAIAAGQGGQIILRNGPLRSLGELFYVPKVANTLSGVELIVAMEGQSDGDSNYRLNPSDTDDRKVLQYLTLRSGLNDGADNDGDGNIDGQNPATAESILAEARVPGLVNVNTAPVEVLEALHYYYGSADSEQVKAGEKIGATRNFVSTGAFALFCRQMAQVGQMPSKDENPDDDGVGSPDGITVDNEEKLFHYTNVANLIGVRSDVFVVYITIQASDRDGDFDNPMATMRTMAIVDRSFCLRPYDANATAEARLKDIPLPRVLVQTTLP